MKIVKVNDIKEMGQVAGDIIASQVKSNPRSILGLATGGSPEMTYKAIINKVECGELSFKEVVTFNLDEYLGLDENHAQSYHYYMQEKFFKYIDVVQENCHIPNGTSNTNQVINQYESLLNDNPVDLQLLGLGVNGHIGFNEPYSNPDQGVHMVQLTAQTRKDNAIYFDSIEEVPTHAITMGIKNIMNARQILLLVNSDKKKEALNALLSGTYNPKWPVTALKDHPQLTVVTVKSAIGESV